MVGGRTALELDGFAHYLAAGPEREVHLYGTEKRPGWVSKLKLESRFVFHNAKRLFPNDVALESDGSTDDPLVASSYVRQRWGKWDWPLFASSPERAILELLDEVPERETFHQVDMEGKRGGLVAATRDSRRVLARVGCGQNMGTLGASHRTPKKRFLGYNCPADLISSGAS